MGIIDIQNVKKDFSGTPVLEDVSFSVREGEKLSLIGRNGAGKTTLVRIVLGLDDDYKGKIRRDPGLTIGYVPQYPDFAQSVTALDVLTEETKSLRAKLSALEGEMANPSARSLENVLAEYQSVRETYDALSGDEAEEKAEKLLSQAGLADKAFQEAATLSGGEKNVLSLLKAVKQRPGLLVLDEPGNHLDFLGLAWLETYLKGYPGAVLMVSHDRRLIDAVADTVVELDRGTATPYSGNYSAYRMEKLKKAQAQGAGADADRKHVEALEALVKRFAEIAKVNSDPAWGKRLRARRSQLERAKGEARTRPDLEHGRMKVDFRDSESKADIALSVEGYSRAMGGKELFRDAGMLLYTGERTALIGVNGCGKTTFLRDLVREGAWDHDVIRVGPSMKTGYCAQNQEVFVPEDTLEKSFSRLGLKRAEAFKLLSKYLFSYADLDRPVSSLSGGELNRLQVAKAECEHSNFLVLDEPTNHLDIASREALEDGLADFEGTILLVSHDRYFLEKIARRVVFVDGFAFNSYEGTFSEFFRDVGRSKVSPGGGIERRGKEIAPGARSGTDAKPVAGNQSVEERIYALEAEKEGLESGMAKAIHEGDWARSRKLSKDADKIVSALSRLYGEL